jgi:hypothetical protein
MLIGYARVSTLDQTLALQQDALTAAGCEQLYTDTVSGSVTERPGLTQALSHLRAGDTLVVWRLDRLGRSLPHLIETVRQLQGAERAEREERPARPTSCPQDTRPTLWPGHRPLPPNHARPQAGLSVARPLVRLCTALKRYT